MKKLLLFARDPGGANVILPVYEKIKDRYEVLAYAKEFAWKRLSEARLPVRNIEEECETLTYADIKDFLKQQKPDMVITGTSLDDFTERYLWKAAEELHIKSFAILDQWMNLGIRFSDCDYSQEENYRRNRRHPYLPYRILAMDELAGELLKADGIHTDKIALTGQPHFDTVRDRFQHAAEIYGRDRWNVVFVSEPIYHDYDGCDETKRYWGYNERTIFDNLYRSLQKAAANAIVQIRLIIRPHPREDRKYWDAMADKFDNDFITLIVDSENDSFSVLKSADLVCGMSSMFLLEAMICGKQVVSVAIGLKRENPFVLDKTGQCKSVLSEADLQERIAQAFLQRSMDSSEKSRERLCSIGYPKGIVNATDKIIQLMEEEMTE